MDEGFGIRNWVLRIWDKGLGFRDGGGPHYWRTSAGIQAPSVVTSTFGAGA